MCFKRALHHRNGRSEEIAASRSLGEGRGCRSEAFPPDVLNLFLSLALTQLLRHNRKPGPRPARAKPRQGDQGVYGEARFPPLQYNRRNQQTRSTGAPIPKDGAAASPSGRARAATVPAGSLWSHSNLPQSRAERAEGS
ncbi:hypothetical protein SKAU_G00104470 [Synaphobranchus kaupii]|uniref:Uncharacterized protein n=1 Tax=Synaphobranchus kaupii TaxID=118154 RepID=A0A9Q1FYV6_SYNKA|nr:hypothetical protein SKAU_G00104470 [Synaphobranchus kaupii]